MALTAPEISSLQRLFYASQNLAAAVSSEMLLVIKDGTTPTTRAPIKAVMAPIVKAKQEIGLAVSDLLGGSYWPDDPNPREFFVARGFAHVDAAIAAMNQARVNADVAVAAGASDYYLSRVKNIRIKWALFHLSAIDRTLQYLDPYPEGRSVQGRILVFGPHGRYDEAQFRLTGALKFGTMAYNALLNAYSADSLLPSYWEFYQQVKFMDLVLMQNLFAMATLAAIPTSTAEAAVNPFFRLLDRMETLLHGGGGACVPDTCHGTPYNYNNLTQRLMNGIQFWEGRPTFAYWQKEAIRRVTEAWDGTDTAVWFMLVFPEGDGVVR